MSSEIKRLVRKEVHLIILISLLGLGGMVLWQAVSWWPNAIDIVIGNL